MLSKVRLPIGLAAGVALPMLVLGAAARLVHRARSARVVAEAAATRERRARDQLDRLIATMTHDLATPLSVLRNTVHLARRRPIGEVDWAQMLVRLDTASVRATTIMRTLSDAQAIVSGGFTLNAERCDLTQVVTPIVAMMDTSADRHPLNLTVPAHPVAVRVDVDRIQRVLENLISNAIKYSPDGGAIEISVDVDGAFGLVRVRDHGIGIAAGALPRIFDHAYRAPGVGTHASGRGLGLTIAAEVVHRHRGTIVAAPAAPRGTVFTVSIPLAADTAGPNEPGANEPRRPA
jgi:signal transduction histidine kinase